VLGFHAKVTFAERVAPIPLARPDVMKVMRSRSATMKRMTLFILFRGKISTLPLVSSQIEERRELGWTFFANRINTLLQR
jgi:hypothetical protein